MQEAIETKRTFVRHVSHEIRTPLNTVSLGLEVLESEVMKLEGSAAIIDIITDLKGSTDNAMSMINDLLAYDKVEAGIMALDVSLCGVWSLIEEAVRPFYIQV